MMRKEKKEKKKIDPSTIILFAVALLIIIFFLWYFFIYVNNNEKLLIQKNFRVLTQLGENFKKRYEAYTSVIESSDIKDALNSLVRDYYPNDYMSFAQKEDYIKHNFSSLKVIKKESSNDKSYIYFTKNDDPLIPKTISFINDNKKDSSAVVFGIKKEDFFQSLERKDVFEEIILIREDSSHKSLFYSSFPGDIEIKSFDSLLIDQKGLSFGSMANIKILGIDYKLFLTPVQLKNNESYFIGGVISQDNYVKETRSINFYVALFITIIFFILFLSIPLIKLKVLSRKQKLKIWDLLLSAFSIVIGSFFILLIIFSFINYSRGKAYIEKELERLSNSIELNFTNEIKKIHSTLNMYDSSIKEDTLLAKMPYKNFKLIFTLDSNGDQVKIITSRKKFSNKDNYKYRRYFIESGEWNMDGKKLMLDFIYSHSTGEQLGVVSLKKKDTVYVITSRLYSVINTLLPPGYGFCVIDNKGDVKFHSDANRMLRENFLDELENPDELYGAMYGRLKLNLNVRYLGKNHSCYIKPISTLPLYLITFFDKSYSNSINIQITSITILFIFLLLFMFFTVLFTSRFAIYKKSDLIRNNDIVDWLRPVEWKSDIYKKAAITNFIAIILVIFFYWINTAENTLILVYLFSTLQLFIILVYTNFLNTRTVKIKFLKRQFIPHVFFIILLYYFAFKVNADLLSLTLFCFILILFNFLSVKYLKSNNKHFNTPTNFYNYLFSWLSLIVILPVVIFSIIFFNNEIKSNTTYNLYYYAKKEAIRNYEIDKFYHDYIGSDYQDCKDTSKIKGVYFNDNIYRLEDSTEFITLKTDSSHMTLNEILFYLRPNTDILSTERKSLVEKIGEFFNKNIKISNDSVILKYPVYQTYYSTDTLLESSLFYKGNFSKFGFSNPEAFILLLLILLFFFYTVYKLIKFTSERIFGISIKSKDNFYDQLNEHITSGNNLIINCTGMYETGLSNYLSKYFTTTINYKETKQYNFFTKHFDESSIVINNIQIDFDNLEEDKKKFSIIRNQAEKTNIQIVIITDKSIEKYLEIIDEKLRLEKDENTQVHLKNLEVLLEILNRNFIHIYAPVNNTNNQKLIQDVNDRMNKNKIPDKIQKVIKDELIALGISDDLIKKYTETMINYLNRAKTVDVEEIILMVQLMATWYYERIWEFCTKEEKLLLMDLSDNFLLNDKNKKVIKIMVDKGLLKKNCFVEMMNESFRNFVNSKSKDVYYLEYLDVRKSGKWSSYRAPILLILLATAFFLALQENVLTSLTSIIPIVLGIITVISKISGIFSKDIPTSATSTKQ